MNAIGYIRVSTEEQTTKHSLSAQRRAIRDYGKLYGLRVVGIYSDDGVTGKTMDKRKDIDECLMQCATVKYSDQCEDRCFGRWE